MLSYPTIQRPKYAEIEIYMSLQQYLKESNGGRWLVDYQWVKQL